MLILYMYLFNDWMTEKGNAGGSDREKDQGMGFQTLTHLSVQCIAVLKTVNQRTKEK